MPHNTSAQNSNGALKLPLPALGVLVTIFLAFLGFWGMWSVARADVANLKTENVEIKKEIAKLSKVAAIVPYMQRDIEEIKQGQQELQKDIKILLQRGTYERYQAAGLGGSTK